MSKSSQKRILPKLNSAKPTWYLAIGVLLMTFSHLSHSLDFMAWFCMTPFLVYLHLTSGWKSRLWFILALALAWSLIVFKIITQPIPVVFVFLYSLPIAFIHLPGYLSWGKSKKHHLSPLLFAAVMTLMEYIQYTFTPLASWGVAAYTQSQSIHIMQFLSVLGMAGLSFLIYWINAALAWFIITGKRSTSGFYLPLISLGLVMVFGVVRFNLSKSKGVDTIAVAAAGTDSEVGGLPLPTQEESEKVIRSIFNRTRKAAQFGAKIVVWNEAAFILEPEYERAWIDSMQLLAKSSTTTIIASFVVPTNTSPLRYENKYLFINSNGDVLNSYLKHEPVPGEPAIRGTRPLQVFRVDETKVGGAICYDYDFPYLARANGALGADIVAVPSSDWRGIDPLHTRMAAFRAVEQGHSVLRSTRFGLSAAISPYGEMTTQMSSFDSNQKTMLATLPKKGVKTIYSVLGDGFVYLCTGFILVFFFNAVYQKNP